MTGKTEQSCHLGYHQGDVERGGAIRGRGSGQREEEVVEREAAEGGGKGYRRERGWSGWEDG